MYKGKKIQFGKRVVTSFKTLVHYSLKEAKKKHGWPATAASNSTEIRTQD